MIAMSTTAQAFFETKSSPMWGDVLARAEYICSQKKDQSNFEKAAKPLLVGVGGYGKF